MSPRLLKQDVGDKQLHTPTYNAMVDACTAFLNMRFDGKFFITQRSPTSFFVSMKSSDAFGTTYKRPFDFNDVAEDGKSFTINDNWSYYTLSILGTNVLLTTGTNMQIVPDTDPYVYQCTLDPATVSTVFVWLTMDRKNGTVTIDAGGIYPEQSGDPSWHLEYIDYKLLWMYIVGLGVTTYVAEDFYDMRNKYEIPGMI